jgi:hypothetical protein
MRGCFEITPDFHWNFQCILIPTNTVYFHFGAFRQRILEKTATETQYEPLTTLRRDDYIRKRLQ